MRRRGRRTRIFSYGGHFGVALAVLPLVWLAAGNDATNTASGPSDPLQSSVHVALGVPVDKTPEDELLLDRGTYVLSYSASRRGANWVAWELDASYLGAVGRSGEYLADELLPPGTPRVTKRDYSGSGYDRGHLCPSGDRTRDRAENAQTFLMTNMHPQVRELNAGPWERLERFERELAQRPGAHLYIVAGGVFDAVPRTIGKNIAVPRASFKAIVPLRRGQGPGDVERTTAVVAVMMPNVPSVGQLPWTSYVTTVDAIERETGYDFFRRIPDPVENAIEARAYRDAM
jgi:endonuclease G